MPKPSKPSFKKPSIWVSSRSCSLSPVKALLFHTLWGWQASLEAASQYAQQSGFDGLEANLEHPCIKGWRPETCKPC